jgi:hypothetical protein
LDGLGGEAPASSAPLPDAAECPSSMPQLPASVDGFGGEAPASSAPLPDVAECPSSMPQLPASVDGFGGEAPASSAPPLFFREPSRGDEERALPPVVSPRRFERDQKDAPADCQLSTTTTAAHRRWLREKETGELIQAAKNGDIGLVKQMVSRPKYHFMKMPLIGLLESGDIKVRKIEEMIKQLLSTIYR